MLRSSRLRYDREFDHGFRLRGREVTRLEGFADAVFGFALTLLVVSLDVPKNFADLMQAMRGFPAFAICFLLLVLIWNSHYRFCRKYGLDDGFTRFLTCVLLFLVLFYVYPLKFLFSISINVSPAATAGLTGSQVYSLLMIYGLGFASVYLALFFLYLHAYRLRDALELTPLERLDTRFALGRMTCLVAVGLLAALAAYLHLFGGWGGLIYFSLLPILRSSRILQRRRVARLQAG